MNAQQLPVVADQRLPVVAHLRSPGGCIQVYQLSEFKTVYEEGKVDDEDVLYIKMDAGVFQTTLGGLKKHNGELDPLFLDNLHNQGFPRFGDSKIAKQDLVDFESSSEEEEEPLQRMERRDQNNLSRQRETSNFTEKGSSEIGGQGGLPSNDSPISGTSACSSVRAASVDSQRMAMPTTSRENFKIAPINPQAAVMHIPLINRRPPVLANKGKFITNLREELDKLKDAFSRVDLNILKNQENKMALELFGKCDFCNKTIDNTSFHAIVLHFFSDEHQTTLQLHDILDSELTFWKTRLGSASILNKNNRKFPTKKPTSKEPSENGSENSRKTTNLATAGKITTEKGDDRVPLLHVPNLSGKGGRKFNRDELIRQLEFLANRWKVLSELYGTLPVFLSRNVGKLLATCTDCPPCRQKIFPIQPNCFKTPFEVVCHIMSPGHHANICDFVIQTSDVIFWDQEITALAKRAPRNYLNAEMWGGARVAKPNPGSNHIPLLKFPDGSDKRPAVPKGELEAFMKNLCVLGKSFLVANGSCSSFELHKMLSKTVTCNICGSYAKGKSKFAKPMLRLNDFVEHIISAEHISNLLKTEVKRGDIDYWRFVFQRKDSVSPLFGAPVVAKANNHLIVVKTSQIPTNDPRVPLLDVINERMNERMTKCVCMTMMNNLQTLSRKYQPWVEKGQFPSRLKALTCYLCPGFSSIIFETPISLFVHVFSDIHTLTACDIGFSERDINFWAKMFLDHEKKPFCDSLVENLAKLPKKPLTSANTNWNPPVNPDFVDKTKPALKVVPPVNGVAKEAPRMANAISKPVSSAVGSGASMVVIKKNAVRVPLLDAPDRVAAAAFIKRASHAEVLNELRMRWSKITTIKVSSDKFFPDDLQKFIRGQSTCHVCSSRKGTAAPNFSTCFNLITHILSTNHYSNYMELGISQYDVDYWMQKLDDCLHALSNHQLPKEVASQPTTRPIPAPTLLTSNSPLVPLLDYPAVDDDGPTVAGDKELYELTLLKELCKQFLKDNKAHKSPELTKILQMKPACHICSPVPIPFTHNSQLASHVTSVEHITKVHHRKFKQADINFWTRIYLSEPFVEDANFDTSEVRASSSRERTESTSLYPKLNAPQLQISSGEDSRSSSTSEPPEIKGWTSRLLSFFHG